MTPEILKLMNELSAWELNQSLFGGPILINTYLGKEKNILSPSIADGDSMHVTEMIVKLNKVIELLWALQYEIEVRPFLAPKKKKEKGSKNGNKSK